jgi:hypothetical protein
MLACPPASVAVHGDEDLGVGRPLPYGRNEAPAERELLQPSIGNVIAARRADDRVVRRVRRMPKPAVAVDEPQIRQVQRREAVSRAIKKGAQSLDRDQRCAQARKQCSLVAAAGTDLENAPEPAGDGTMLEQQLDHPRDDPGLRDRLTIADGQCRILVGLGHQASVDERMALHAPHGGKHRLAPDAIGAQPCNHAVAHRLRIQSQTTRQRVRRRGRARPSRVSRGRIGALRAHSRQRQGETPRPCAHGHSACVKAPTRRSSGPGARGP